MYKRVSLSLDETLVDVIDKERGDVTRSRFLQKLIELYIREKEEMSYKSKPCNRGCGTAIHFDESMRSARGKPIPLEDNNEPHQCPNATPYTGQGPAVARVSNPIEKLASGTWQDHANDRDLRIKEAQEQRLVEHTELIRAMKETHRPHGSTYRRNAGPSDGNREEEVDCQQWRIIIRSCATKDVVLLSIS